MARTGNTNVLRQIAALFNFAGTYRGSGEIDVERPIALVHDVGQGARGLASILVQDSVLVTTAGAGAPVYSTRDFDSVFDDITVDTQLRSLGLTKSNVDVYLVRMTAAATAATAANFDTAVVAISPRRTSRYFVTANPGVEAHPLRLYNALGATWESGGESPCRESEVNPFYDRSVELPMPMGTLYLRTKDTGAGAVTVRYKPVYCIVPEGAPPLL